MSLNPLAGSADPPDIAAMIAGELTSLAADARLLSTQLSTGDVVAAVVLRSNGLTDLLDIHGLRVAAELPATVVPGDRIHVMVTGFNDDRIHLQIVPPGEEPAAAPATKADATTAVEVRAPAVGAAGAAVMPDVPAASRPRARPEFTAPAPAIVAPPAALKSIEARIAAAYATNSLAFRSSSEPPRQAAWLPAPGKLPQPAAVVPRPLISVRPPPSTAPTTRSPIATPTTSASTTTATAAAAPKPVTEPRGTTAFTEPAALLRALRLPVTASNLAAARMALESPQKLPNALATLERALASSGDPRVATLSTLTSFVARMQPQSPHLATQLSTFVDQVVTGREAKLATLVPAMEKTPAGVPTDPPQPGRGAPLANDRSAILAVSLDYDLKTQLLRLAAAPEGTGAALPKAAALSAAVAGALTAITSLQLNAAAALNADPTGLAFVVPIALPDGFAQARVRIDRDAPGTKAPLDGDNFHLAFVLETRHLGTIAIEVQTVGRAVNLSVKTEATVVQRRFDAALGDLSTRLEKLRYRVLRAEAVIAPETPDAKTPSDAAPATAAPGVAARLVDIDA